MAKATLLLESTKPLLGGSSDVIKLELGGQSMESAAAGVVDHLCRLYGKDWAAAIDRLRELCGVETDVDAHHQALRARDEVIERLSADAKITKAKLIGALNEAAELRLTLEECARYEPAYVSSSSLPLVLCSACGEVFTLPTEVSKASAAHFAGCTAQSPDDTPTELLRLYVERVGR